MKRSDGLYCRHPCRINAVNSLDIVGSHLPFSLRPFHTQTSAAWLMFGFRVGGLLFTVNVSVRYRDRRSRYTIFRRGEGRRGQMSGRRRGDVAPVCYSSALSHLSPWHPFGVAPPCECKTSPPLTFAPHWKSPSRTSALYTLTDPEILIITQTLTLDLNPNHNTNSVLNNPTLTPNINPNILP